MRIFTICNYSFCTSFESEPVECFQIASILSSGASAYTFDLLSSKKEEYLLKICGLGWNRNPLDIPKIREDCIKETSIASSMRESNESTTFFGDPSHLIIAKEWACEYDPTFENPLKRFGWILEKKINVKEETLSFMKHLQSRYFSNLQTQKNYFCNIFGGLLFLHAHNICHNDLHASNILVNEIPQKKFFEFFIIDFNAAGNTKNKINIAEKPNYKKVFRWESCLWVDLVRALASATYFWNKEKEIIELRKDMKLYIFTDYHGNNHLESNIYLHVNDALKLLPKNTFWRKSNKKAKIAMENGVYSAELFDEMLPECREMKSLEFCALQLYAKIDRAFRCS